MFRCVPYTDSMQEEWDRLAKTRGTVFHTIAFRRILIDSFGYGCAYHAVVNETGRVCALLPLVTGRNLGLKRVGMSLPFVNYTDICADDEAACRFAVQSFPEMKRRLGLHYIELRLQDQRIDGPDWSHVSHHYTFKLPLTGTEEQILALSSSSNRNHVRKVYKNDWFDVSFDPSHLEPFYEVYVRRMKQLGSPAPHIRYFRSFFEQLPEQAALLSVLDKATGQVVGGMLLLASPTDSTLYYPYGANLSEYNGKYLNNFMYWEAVRYGIRCGLSSLDLGRSQAGSGTYKYKEQWGAAPVQLKYSLLDGGQGTAGPDKENLGFFIEMWKAAPRFVTDPVGRMLIKYLMP